MPFSQIKVELCSHWGGDRDAAEGAWASTYDKAKAALRSDEDVRRVVTGLVNLNHDTPKERVWLDFFITCPIFVERQFDKYRMTVQYQDFRLEYLEASFGRLGITQNELSGRYRTIPDRPYRLPGDVASITARAETHDLQQGEFEEATTASEVQTWWNLEINRQHDLYQIQLDNLKKAEKDGVITNTEYKRAREVLRGLLGTAFLTDMRIVLNLNAFEHIVNQRLAREAQMESRVVAWQMVATAMQGGVAPVMIGEMIKANGWQPLLDEVFEACKHELVEELKDS
jgi:thymidylate synthase ThyX